MTTNDNNYLTAKASCDEWKEAGVPHDLVRYLAHGGLPAASSPTTGEGYSLNKLPAPLPAVSTASEPTALSDIAEMVIRRIVARGVTVTPKRLTVEKEAIECERLRARGFSPEMIAEQLPTLTVDTIRRRLGLKD